MTALISAGTALLLYVELILDIGILTTGYIL